MDLGTEIVATGFAPFSLQKAPSKPRAKKAKTSVPPVLPPPDPIFGTDPSDLGPWWFESTFLNDVRDIFCVWHVFAVEPCASMPLTGP